MSGAALFTGLSHHRDGVICPNCNHGMTDRETCQWCGYPDIGAAAAATSRAVRLLESYAKARTVNGTTAAASIADLANHHPVPMDVHHLNQPKVSPEIVFDSPPCELLAAQGR